MGSPAPGLRNQHDRDQHDEESIEASLRFIDSVIEALPDMVFVKDARTLKFVRFNRAGEELLGYPRADLIGRSDYDFFPREQADGFTARDRAVLAGREAVDIPEEPILTRDKGTRILHTKKIPLLGRDGRPAFLLGLSEDITDRKREQEKRNDFLAEASPLLTSSLDYRATLRSIAKLAVPALADWCTVTIAREDGTLERLAAIHGDESKTPLIEELRTYYPDNTQGQTGIAEVIRTGKSQLVSQIAPERLVDAARDQRHLELMRSLGTSSCMVVPIPGRNRIHGAIALVHGDSGRAYNEEDLHLAEELGRRAGVAIENALLYEAARTAVLARDEFLSIASHELKTPITALKLHTEMSRRRLEDEAPLAPMDRVVVLKLLESTDRHVDRLVRLVDDLLDITRIASGKLTIRPEVIDLGLLVREVVDRFDTQLRAAGCRYRLDRESDIVGHWDRYRLEQVVTNLLTNAIKYGANSPIEVSVTSGGSVAVLRVRDQGIGIAPENLEKLFRRFERAAAPRETTGLGLGLYICRQIVEGHRGTIRAESQLGKGSTFIVELPLK